MSRLGGLLWWLLPSVRGSERSRVVFFAGLFTLLSAAQTMGLAGSEALLLAELGPGRLPEIFIAASLVTVLGSMLYASRVGAARNDDLFLQMLLGSGVLLGSATLGAAVSSAWVIGGLFCAFYLTQAVFVNHFWTFSGDYFDTLTSKRLFPVFTVGSSLGGLLGGLATAGVTRVAGPVSLIAAWGLLLGAAGSMLWLGRRPLRRWGPLDLEEADETSVEGIRGAARYLRGSALGFWLVLSALGMVLAIFIAQYLYSTVFASEFGDASGLATFFGIYLAVTNGIEIALELALTPWLIRRVGVPTAHLVHPLLTLLSFGGLAAHYGMISGVAARVNRELVENAVAQPIRTLVYNALPPRFRGRIRAFLEGIVVYAGMSAAGVLLLLLGDPDPFVLSIAGGLAAVLYLVANLRARQEYLRTLVSGIRAGRLDLADLDDEIGNWEASRLADLCDQLLAEEAARPSRSLRQIVPSLGHRGIAEPLVRGAHHPSGEVRRLCIEALASCRGENVELSLAKALRDADATVRLAALRALAGREPRPEGLARRLADLMHDPDPRVRAEAASHSDDGALRRMIGSSDRDEALAALGLASEAQGDAVLARVRDEDPVVRAAALARLAAISEVVPLPIDEVLEALEAPHAAVRRAAVSALAGRESSDAVAALAGALGDVPEVQEPAIRALAALGEQGIEASLPYLRDDRERAAEGALEVIAESGARGHRELLTRELRHRVRQLWFRVIAYQRLPLEGDIPAEFLRLAYADAMMRSRRLAFRTLELLESEQIIRRVQKALRFGTSRSRSDALEVLSNLGDRESAELLVLLHETGSLSERLTRVESIVRVPRDFSTLLEASLRSEVPWIRLGAAAFGAPLGENPGRVETMERLLALKQIPLFANLTLEQLEAVQQRTRESAYLEGEVIVHEGDAGGELYLLLEGSVEVTLNHGSPQQERLNVMEAVVYFGEMAIFDDEPRSATIVALERSRLLTLDGASLKELVRQMPEISFEIFRVLTARVRTAERRLVAR